MPKPSVEIGSVYGMLTVISFHHIKYSKKHFLCMCSCGNTTVLSSANIRGGYIKSCGCLASPDKRKAWKQTHGATGTPTYITWKGMFMRCKSLAPNTKPYYLDRGISVCERWNDFSNFLADMGERPSRGYSIDRIDPDKGYEPGNCRWATVTEQSRNRRNVRQKYLPVEVPQ